MNGVLLWNKLEVESYSRETGKIVISIPFKLNGNGYQTSAFYRHTMKTAIIDKLVEERPEDVVGNGADLCIDEESKVAYFTFYQLDEGGKDYWEGMLIKQFFYDTLRGKHERCSPLA